MNSDMTEDLTHILVFKTNITTSSDKLLVQQLLAENDAIQDWSVDCEDIDCVLRIVSYVLCAAEIVALLGSIGFKCEELE